MLNTHTTIRSRHRGFTLVEMLVATALVLLVMLMFAQIYSAAISTITDQKGLANNDAKARALDVILRSDLEKLTFRQILNFEETRGIVPLAPNVVVDPNQRGYLYISENNVADDTDDVFQATIDTTLTERSSVEQFLYGKARALNVSRNEPDRDDGIANNSLASSTAAEVAYFVRNGNLYRRVMLLRNPLGSRLDEPAYSSDPTDTNDVNRPLLFYPNYSGGSGSFWNDYDFSATQVLDASSATGYRLHFSGREDLDNSATSGTYPIAFPTRRFGFSPTNGRPGEYDNAGVFLGRLTQGETSNSAFLYPGVWDGSANPYDNLNTNGYSYCPVTLNTTTGVVTGLQNGPRTSEDLLLTHVSQFNIEVWDTRRNGLSKATPPVGAFTDLGGPVAVDYPGTTTFGPNGPFGNRAYDTWHPGLGSLPPYQPVHYPASATTMWQANWTPPTGTLAIPTSGNPSFVYRLIRSGEDLDGDGTADADLNGNSAPDYGLTGGTEPSWPTEHGVTFSENGGTPANQVTWQAIDNRVGLEAIRFTIRYLDLGSGQERQLTIVHSFVED